MCTLYNAVCQAITFCLSVVQFQLQRNMETIRINIKIQITFLAWNLGLQRFGLGSCQSKTEGKLGCDVKIACFFPTKVWKCWGTFNCGVSQSTSSLESKVY